MAARDAGFAYIPKRSIVYRENADAIVRWLKNGSLIKASRLPSFFCRRDEL